MNPRSYKSSQQSTKNAYYVLEKTRQQLKLRKDFLHHISIPDERVLFSGENPQQLITFSNTRTTVVLENQALAKANSEKQQNDQIYPDKEETLDKYAAELLLPVDLLLPTVTSGESSPNESDEDTSQSRRKQKAIPTNTSLEDVLPYLIDSSLLTIERDAPPAQKKSFSSNGRSDHNYFWGNCFELLFLNIDVSLSAATIKHDIRNKFYSMPFICFESMRTFYYHGKYSMLVTLANEKQAQIVFAYFRSHSQQFRQLLGDNLELYRVTMNNLDTPTRSTTKRNYPHDQQNEFAQAELGWIPVIFRNLPGYFDKSNFQRILTMVALPAFAVKSIEEPILLNAKKHCMALLSDVDSAFTLICQLPAKLKEFPHFRVNLHPGYSKQAWRVRDRLDNTYYSFYERKDQNRFQQSYSKTNQHLQFQKYFLEDVQNIHKGFKQFRPSYLKQNQEEDEMKKLSQRSTTPKNHRNHLDLDYQEQTVSMHTPSAIFNPINYNYEITQIAEDFLKQRSTHNLGNLTPSEKQRISEFHAHMNHSPDRIKKHRRHGIKDQNKSSVEDKMYHSSLIKLKNSDIHQETKEYPEITDLSMVYETIQNPERFQDTQEFHQISPQKNPNHKEYQDGSKSMNSNKKEGEFSNTKNNSKLQTTDEQLNSKPHDEEQNNKEEENEQENEELLDLRQNQLRDGNNTKNKSKTRNSSSSSNSNCRSSSDNSSKKQKSQNDKQDRKNTSDLLNYSNKKLKSNMEEYILKKEKLNASNTKVSELQSETHPEFSEEQKHFTIMQKINLQNQDKSMQLEDISGSPNNSRSRSRKTENDEKGNKQEDLSPPRNRISYEPEEQIEKITSLENNKKGISGEKLFRKDSEEGELHYKHNGSTENNNRYPARNSNSNNNSSSEYNYHQNSNNGNYKYRDMRKGRNNSYLRNQKNDDNSPNRNNSYSNYRYRHSRSNSPRRFKHPRSFISKQY